MPIAERLEATAAAFRDAALGLHSWDAALSQFADALNSRTGQLIAIGRRSLIPLNIMTRMPEEAAAEFAAAGGSDPFINSRVRAGMMSGELEFRDDAHFTPELDRSRSPEFGAWIDRYDIGYACLSNLVKSKGELIGLATLRSRSEGEMTAAEKRAYQVLSGHARAAVVLRNSVEEQALDLLAATLDQVDTAAAIVDLTGRVRALTARGEDIVASGRFLRLVDGQLIPQRPDQRDQFQASLGTALQSRAMFEIAPPGPLVLSDRDGGRLLVEILPLPAGHSFRFAAALMIVFRGGKQPNLAQKEILQALFDLTETEARVAELLLSGNGPAEIASHMNISVGTVRNHVHRILVKSHCTSQVEFVARAVEFV